MKTDRLLGILTTIQQKKKVTAAALAEKFEVSERTIHRDIDAICRAGIPLVTQPGKNGGISMMDGYAIDTTLFTEAEMSAIFTGLQTLDSVSNHPSAERLASKIGGDSRLLKKDCIEIDLSSFYKDDLAGKIAVIREAVKKRQCISFTYYYDKGEEEKFIEPYSIRFKWSDWYVYGYCPAREAFRLYKLRRLWNLTVTDKIFQTREIPEEKAFGNNMTDDYYITAVFEPCVKYRLVEEYGPDSFTVQEDGSLWTRWGFSTTEWAMTWFLSFGDRVKVLDPPEFVERMREKIKKIAELYE